MILIWRGWGIIVVPIVFIAFFAAIFLSEALIPLGLTERWSQMISLVVASVAAAAAIWFSAKAIAGRPTKRLVDPESGQQYLITRDAGSLFFIPTRFWAFIVIALGLLTGVILVRAPEKPLLSEEAQSVPAEWLESSAASEH